MGSLKSEAEREIAAAVRPGLDHVPRYDRLLSPTPKHFSLQKAWQTRSTPKGLLTAKKGSSIPPDWQVEIPLSLHVPSISGRT